MAPSIEVREALESDRDVLMDFHRKLYLDHRDQVVGKEVLPLIEYRDYERLLREDLSSLLEERISHVLVAESGGIPVGYITGRVTVEPARVMPRKGMVEDWYVTPHSRGSGIGGRLLREIEKRFEAAGCEVIESATWSANGGARRAHLALGFREIRVIYRKRI